MMLSKVLCDRYHELNQAAMAEDEYGVAFVYSTAEDLTDGMLKGTGVTKAPFLIEAFERNAARTDDADERDAWLNAVTVAREVLNLPATDGAGA